MHVAKVESVDTLKTFGGHFVFAILGRLIVVIPFVAKILECCAKSKIFGPPNPWLMSLVSLVCHRVSTKKGIV